MTLLIDLRAQGHTLKLSGDKILFTPAPGTIWQERQRLLTTMRELKQELIAALVAEEPRESRQDIVARCGATYCAGCYAIAPGQHIHPPRGRNL